MLALVLGGESAPGPRPTFEEIAAWHAGRLREPRASKVKAHVARDPECYRFWYELRLEERAQVKEISTEAQSGTLPDERDQRLWTRLKSLLPVGVTGMGITGLAGAMALVFAVMIALPLIRSPDLYQRIDRQYAVWGEDALPEADIWPWRKKSVEKGLRSLQEMLAKPDPEKNAFRVGVRRGLQILTGNSEQWQKTIDGLPETMLACDEGEAKTQCQEKQHLQQAAGQWSVLVFLSCKGGAPRAQGFWVEQYELLDALRGRLAPVGESGELTRYLSRWKPDASGGSVPLCEGAETLLGLGLSG